MNTARRGCRLPVAFYRRPDVVAIARDLLGKQLCTRLPLLPQAPGAPAGPPVLTAGLIVETEAYAGPEDRASHAFGNRRTPRTEVMFAPGGVAYVYLCYGLHALFNVVTHAVDIPHAVLVRAIHPTQGLSHMRQRRGAHVPPARLAAGPGTLACALGITVDLTRASLLGPRIWIEDVGCRIPDRTIVAGPRIGVDYAGPHARRPWRFRIPALAFATSGK